MLLKDALERGGTENAQFEAEQLLQSAGVDKITLISEPNREVFENISAEIRAKTKRRLSGEPLQYILGEWEFYGLPFKVGDGVLIPRQDTETLVDVSLKFLNERERGERKTLDLCAGSGCIGITLAKHADAEVTCVEKSEWAFGYLRENIALNGVSVNAVSGDVLKDDTVCGEYDLIVSNPPYLTDGDMMSLQKEVRFEPRDALYGGADGLDFYKCILGAYPKKLKGGGMIAVEIGMGQENSVCGIFRENGIEPRLEKDMCGVYRVVYGIKQTQL